MRSTGTGVFLSCAEQYYVLCQDYTVNRVQGTQYTTRPRLERQKTLRWKIDCERRREEHKTLLRLPSPKSLNYYWLLIYYLNIVHTYGPIRNKSL